MARYLTEHRYGEGNRSVHVPKNLAEIMAHAGEYDQLNLPSLARVELVAG